MTVAVATLIVLNNVLWALWVVASLVAIFVFGLDPVVSTLVCLFVTRLIFVSFAEGFLPIPWVSRLYKPSDTEKAIAAAREAERVRRPDTQVTDRNQWTAAILFVAVFAILATIGYTFFVR
jgi:hypothetical protein